VEKFLDLLKKNRIIVILLIIILLSSYSLIQTSLLYKIADYLDTKGMFVQEETVLNVKLFLSPSSYALKKVIKFYNIQKEYKKSIFLYETCIEECELHKLYRGVLFHPNINEARVYSDLAWLYYLDKQYDKAILFYNKALVLKASTPQLEGSSDTYDEAEEHNGLVYTYIALKDFNKAKANLDKSFEIVKKMPVNSLRTIFSTNLTATDYYLEFKDYSKAEYYANKLFLTIPSSTLPIDSYINYQTFYLIIANSQMGEIKFKEAKFEEAQLFQRKALFMTEELYGEKSPKTMCAYTTLLQTLNKESSDTKYKDYIEYKVLTTGKNLIMFKDKKITIDDIAQFCKK